MKNLGWTPGQLESQHGKTYVITGANSGIGFETSRILLDKGATIIMLNRNQERSRKALSALQAEFGNNAKVSFIHVDLASQKSILDGAKEVLETVSTIDALICNAAVFNLPSQKLTEDGFEYHLGVNHYGHFLLSGVLFDRLDQSNGRIVVVGSEGYKWHDKRIQFDDMNWNKNYHPNKVYCHSKLAQMMFAYELQDRIKMSSKNVSVYVCHPGASTTSLAKDTRRVERFVFELMSFTPFVQSATKGAYPEVMCAAEKHESLNQKAYYGPTGRLQWTGPVGECDLELHVKDKPVAEKLWALSESATKLNWEL